MDKLLYIEACDFESFPLGGTLTFAKQFLRCFQKNIYLVGIAKDDEPVGEWFVREINGTAFNFFGITNSSSIKNTKIPKRLFVFWALNKHIKKIREISIDNVFTQSPQFVFTLSKYKWSKFIYLFAGIGNSVSLSKFKILRVFGETYEKRLFNKLKKNATHILAAADKKSIDNKLQKHNLAKNRIKPFPTRFDENIFSIKNSNTCRDKLKISEKTTVFLTTGRLAYIKGWPLLIDSFKLVKEHIPDSILIFIGSGEDKNKLQSYISDCKIDDSVYLVGRKEHKELNEYLNAANVFLMGSHTEGWPTSMVEAIACGKPIVTTNVSGATEMVFESQNGYILKTRSANEFANAMLNAVKLQNPNDKSLELATKYSLKGLKNDFIKLFES